MEICKKCNINPVRSRKSHYCDNCFKEIRKQTRKNSYNNRKESENKYSKNYKKRNKKYIHDYNQQYAITNKLVLSQKRKGKRLENGEKLNSDSREWRKNNKDKVRAYNRKHVPLYRKKYPWIYACRTLLNNTTKRLGTQKEDKTVNLLRYSALELKNHIESKFLPGMSWNNYGKWHIDHIRPISNFPKDTPIHIINGLSNLQPLWSADNLIKGKKYTKNDF